MTSLRASMAASGQGPRTGPGSQHARLRTRARQRWQDANAAALEEVNGVRAAAGSNGDASRCLETGSELWLVDRVQRVLDRQARERQRPGPPHHADRAATRVLVADQRPAERVLLLHMLRRDGSLCVVGDAIDGTEALALCIDEQPDVLVIDERLSPLPATDVIDQLTIYAPGTRCVLLVDERELARQPPRAGDLLFPRYARDRRALLGLIVDVAVA
jgi:CheY-like chemotaxis protein